MERSRQWLRPALGTSPCRTRDDPRACLCSPSLWQPWTDQL